MKNILVTGGKGQLASCLKDISIELTDYKFIFLDYDELDITKKEEVDCFFKEHEISYCINCAAYTAVDKAELDKEKAFLVNAEGVKYLAEACGAYKTILIHISTDFVFDGSKGTPYTENDIPNPINVYGTSKLQGEKFVQQTLARYFILRTSWVYSEYGNNFVRTMLRLAREKKEINVVTDQVGSPTYAWDLASTIMQIISSKSTNYGLYHYSNEGEISWYDFAKAIFEHRKIKVIVLPITSEEFPSLSRRPKFSVMDKSKVRNILEIEVADWKDSLNKCLKKLKS